MSRLKSRTLKKSRRKTPVMDASAVIQRAIADNPEVRAVLEIALRARKVEAREPPRVIGMATDVVALPTNSQCPV
jgi:hypothetical protein